MKQIFFCFLLSLFFTSCKKTFTDDETLFKKHKTFKIIDGACGSIKYQGKIGNNFDSALDSLIKLREPFIYGNPRVEEYYIEKEIMTIDFKYDDRVFFSIGFTDSRGLHIFSLTDVIDSKGSYFVIRWCKD